MHFNTYLHWAVLLWTLQSQQVEEDEIYHKALQGDLAASTNKYTFFVLWNKSLSTIF